MAIRHKRTTTTGYTWQSGDTVEGQIGLNLTDGTLHFKKGNGTYVTISEGAGGIDNVVEDTTPQLGGNLDVNGNSIVSTSNGNITIEPNGTGDVHIITDALRVGDLNSEARISTYGTGNLVLTTNEGNDPDPTITIGNGAKVGYLLPSIQTLGGRFQGSGRSSEFQAVAAAGSGTGCISRYHR